MEDELSEQVVVVTGASRGFGRAAATAFARGGASVVAIDSGQDLAGRVAGFDGLAATVQAVEAAGGTGIAVEADITTQEGATAAMHEAMDRFGRVDVLVCGAAVNRPGSILDLSIEDWDATIAGTLKAAFTVVHDAAVIMRQQRRGSIILSGSALGMSRLSDTTGRVPFTAASAGMYGFVRVISKDLARYGVNANAIDVAAADVNGDGPSPWVPAEEGGEAALQMAGTLARFLSTDAAADVSGEVFLVSGTRIGLHSRHRVDQVVQAPNGWTPEGLATVFGDTLEGPWRLASKTLRAQGELAAATARG